MPSLSVFDPDTNIVRAACHSCCTASMSKAFRTTTRMLLSADGCPLATTCKFTINTHEDSEVQSCAILAVTIWHFVCYINNYSSCLAVTVADSPWPGASELQPCDRFMQTSPSIDSKHIELNQLGNLCDATVLCMTESHLGFIIGE